MDDESGWTQILLEVWSPEVRDAVVEHIERSSVGRHGWLVRVFADLDGGSGPLTEIVHAVVLAAIRDETGADLDGLGNIDEYRLGTSPVLADSDGDGLDDGLEHLLAVLLDPARPRIGC